MSEDVIKAADVAGDDADDGADDPVDHLDDPVDHLDDPVDHLDDGVDPDSRRPAAWRPLRRRGTSKWDRPPGPLDWRFFVGTLGKVLVATGLLLFGFVGYQLWGTGIETAHAQSRLDGEFAALLIQTAPIEPEAPADPPIEIQDVRDIPVQVDPPVAEQSIVPVEQDLPPIFEGAGIARLQIPRIDLDWVVVAGVSPEDLQNGPGHFPDTPLPGQLGNAAIAGHRTTWGQPFRNIDELEPGDRIVATTPAGQFVYEVTGTQIVQPDDYYVVATTNPEIAELTLTSCHPVFSASKRIVISALLRPDLSADVGVATSYEAGLADENATTATPSPASPASLPAEAPVVETPTTDVSIADTVADAPELPAAGAAIETSDTLPSPITVDTETPAGAEDAFARGWFHDSSANPQVGLWGLALTFLAVGAYLVSRRFRSDLIGLGIAVLPFTVALYFFFQNVNRLLPPNL